ncbi:SET domain-containing protein SmydA-8 isoform X2 [Drosophila montana]|uniref:SET domain-containing protein SmydA-8 isoform X2 n=1 Tax=Drosophila montana TaxID=40370 RepID=UPI00313A96C9
MPAKKHRRQHKQQAKAQAKAQAQARVQAKESELESESVPAFRVAHSELFGRYLVANRQLAAGELLITEQPLAIGPCVSCEPVCLGCYRPVQLTVQQYRCPGCGWPLCGASCRGLQQRRHGHTEEECGIYGKRRWLAAELLGESATPDQVRDLYELVLIVRIALLRHLAPDLYAQIRRMESHTAARRENPTLWQHYEQKVVRRLRDDWQLDVEAAELHEICGILDVNCFEIGQRGAKARTLYPSAFLLAHDCSPNTAHTDDPASYAILLRTSRVVRDQEPLTLSYAYTLQGTLKRRSFIQGGKLFWCQCQRCADPRELGSDCSALVCKSCQLGSMRATSPLDQSADWACDRCAHRLGAVQLERLLDRINDDLESIDVHDIPALENFLVRYREVLRPNHYLLLSAKYSLCQTYGRIEGYLLPELSPEDIERKERYCREFLAVIDLLEPGLTRLRGLIMYELHAPIMVLAQLGMQTGQMSRQEFQKRIKEVVKLLKESAHILQLEPPGSSEHEMGRAAADALIKMGC